MAQLTSRKTLTRAGAVAAAAGGSSFAANRYFDASPYAGTTGVLSSIVIPAAVAGSAAAFFEYQDAN